MDKIQIYRPEHLPRYPANRKKSGDCSWNPKKVENHIGAIKFFICHYNLEKVAALPV